MPKKKSLIRFIAFVAIFCEFIVPSLAGAFTSARMNRNAVRFDYALTSKVVPPSPRNTDTHMGFSMALSSDGTTLVAGAPIDGYDVAGANYLANAGAVYVYVKSAGVWVFQQKLTAPVRRASTQFGRAVAVNDDTIVVGVPLEAYDEAESTSLSNAGAAYVFTRSSGTWTFRKKLVGSGTNGRMNNDQFGYAVAVDNGTIAVGIWYQDYDAAGAGGYVNAAGAVMVYTGTGATWTLQQRIVAGSSTGGRVAEARFGCSLALRGDNLVVGAQNESLDDAGANSLSDAGAAYVLTRSGSTWTQQAKLVAKGSGGRLAGDAFGIRVAYDSDTVVVGSYGHPLDNLGFDNKWAAGAAYVYTRSGSTWSFQEKLVAVGTNGRNSGDRFGVDVGVSGDVTVIGSFYNGYDDNGANQLSGAGVAFIYKRTGNSWKFQKRMIATGTNARQSGDEFGGNVAISGNTIAASARLHRYDETGANAVSNSGAVFIFDKK